MVSTRDSTSSRLHHRRVEYNTMLADPPLGGLVNRCAATDLIRKQWLVMCERSCPSAWIRIRERVV